MSSEDSAPEDCIDTALPVRAVMRKYLSTNHIYAARYAAEGAEEREKYLIRERPIFDVRHRGLVLTAVMESVAFLEAAVNEIFQDSADGHYSYVGALPESCLKLMAGLWSATGRGHLDTLDKFDLALQFAAHEPFGKGADPYQNARLIIQLRNYLVHYKPHDVAADTEHTMEKKLRGKFSSNQLMSGSGNPWLPDHALGAGCAAWAWRSARSLADEFASRMSIRLNYQRVDFGDPLPA